MSKHFWGNTIPRDILDEEEEAVEATLSSRISEFHLDPTKNGCVLMRWTLINGKRFSMNIDPRAFGHWKPIKNSEVRKFLRKTIGFLLQGCDRAYGGYKD